MYSGLSIFSISVRKLTNDSSYLDLFSEYSTRIILMPGFPSFESNMMILAQTVVDLSRGANERQHYIVTCNVQNDPWIRWYITN